MNKSIFLNRRWFLAVFLFFLPIEVVAASDLEVVTVTGQGMTAKAARRDAYRNAIEQGGKLTIGSYSQTENFELIKDTVISKAEGIVTGLKILEEGEGVGGVYTCKVRASVNKNAIASTWTEVQNVLEQVGRPGIALYIEESVDGVVQVDSILESRLEKRLLDLGFKVFSGSHIREIARKESADAAAEGDAAKLQRIAKNFGTQIFITGSAQANGAGLRELAGQPTAMYNCSATVRMFYTDNGQLIASESLPNTRGGARGESALSTQAGKKALANAGDDLVEKVYISVMRRWATRVTSGGEITLEISSIGAGQALKLKRKLLTIDKDKIRHVSQTYSKGTATYRILTLMSAEEFAEHLVTGEFASILEVKDMQTSRIQAKALAP